MTNRQFTNAMLALTLLTVVLVALLLSGCATARVATAGWSQGGHPLLTVVTTTSREEAKKHCHEVAVAADLFSARGADNLAGCKLERIAPDGWRLFKVVRTVEALPSERDLMFEAHEYCHVLESLLGHRSEPCHQRGEHDIAVALLARRTRRRRRVDEDDEVWRPIEAAERGR